MAMRVYLSWIRGPESESGSRKFDPSYAHQFHGRLIQRLEKLFYKQPVGGSSPSPPTIASNRTASIQLSEVPPCL